LNLFDILLKQSKWILFDVSIQILIKTYQICAFYSNHQFDEQFRRAILSHF